MGTRTTETPGVELMQTFTDAGNAQDLATCAKRHRDDPVVRGSGNGPEGALFATCTSTCSIGRFTVPARSGPHTPNRRDDR
jgi:hypothetical protein